jgi:hypothetical protein
MVRHKLKLFQDMGILVNLLSNSRKEKVLYTKDHETLLNILGKGLSV